MKQDLYLLYDCGCLIWVTKDSKNLEQCFFHGKGVRKSIFRPRTQRENGLLSNAKAHRIDPDRPGGG